MSWLKHWHPEEQQLRSCKNPTAKIQHKRLMHPWTGQPGQEPCQADLGTNPITSAPCSAAKHHQFSTHICLGVSPPHLISLIAPTFIKPYKNKKVEIKPIGIERDLTCHSGIIHQFFLWWVVLTDTAHPSDFNGKSQVLTGHYWIHGTAGNTKKGKWGKLNITMGVSLVSPILLLPEMHNVHN